MLEPNDKVKEIAGQRFRIVKNGVDNAEVSSFISRLVEHNSHLANKLEHLNSLSKLAERTVIEAEKQAKSIRIEAEREANAKATTIIANTQEQAKSEAEKVFAELKQRAEEAAQTKVSLAERRADEIMKEAQAKADEVKGVAQEEVSRIAAAVVENAKKEALVITKQAHELLTRSRRIAESEVAEKFREVCQEFLSTCDVSEETTALSIEKTDGDFKPSEPLPTQQEQSKSIGEQVQEQSPLIQKEEERKRLNTCNGTIELALPFPASADSVMQLHKHLVETPHLKVLGMKGSWPEGIKIRLLLHTPTDLVSILQALPEVEKVSAELAGTENIYSSQQGVGESPEARIVVAVKGRNP